MPDREAAPTVRSLVGSIAFVLVVPWLVWVLVELFTGGFGGGVPELLVVWLTWFVGIAVVVRSWRRRRREAQRPPT